MESLVKITKKCLKAALKDHIVTEETLRTYLVEIENVINSRPLTSISNDPNDTESLTPNHFLLGRASPNQNFVITPEKTNFRAKWKITQSLTNIFWRKWIKEYLPTLSRRNKWTNQNLRNIQKGDLVIVVEDNIERSKWPLARVIETYPGRDQIIRSAKIKTAINELVRPVAKLCLLEEGS